MKIICFIILIFTGFINLINAQAQNIFIQLRQPPPYQFHVEDFWKVTITNTSPSPVRVYLYGIATSNTEGPIVDATTAVFTVNQGVKMVKAHEIGPIDVNKQNQTYSDIVKKFGGLPSGFYQICVYVRDAASNQTLAVDCIDHEVQNFTEVELLLPVNNSVISNEYFEVDDVNSTIYTKKTNTSDNPFPVLKIPDSPFGTFDKYTIEKIKNAEEVSVGEGQFIVFNWIPPSPVPINYRLKYKLNVVEVLARQTAYDAMKTNPYFYTNSNITTSTFQYPLSASSFNTGKSYAWQVTAYVNNIQISKSEIWEFTYLNFRSWGMEPSLKGNISFSCPGMSPKDVLESLREERLSCASMNLMTTSKSKPFEFNMYSKTYGEFSSSRTLGNEQPRILGNIELVPTLKIYGVPFSMPVFLSSQGNPDKQRINTFGLMFDKDHWRKKIESMINDEKDKITKRIEDEKTKLEQRMLMEKDKIVNKFNDEKDKIKEMIESEKAELEQKLIQEKENAEKKLYDEKDKLEKNLLTNKEKQISEIKDGKKLLKGALKWVSYIKSLEFGTTYPDYTKYTVTGISSTGYNIEYNPGLLYLAASGYRTQKAIPNESFKRNLFAGRLGIGEKDLSHFIFTYMYAKDDESSMTVDTAVIKTLTPASNHLFGVVGKLSLFNNRLRIEAEGNASLFTRDVTAASMTAEDIPKFMVDMFNPKISSNLDYMYTFKTEFDNEKSNTKVMASMIMIGPGYYSLGAPTIRNDKLGFEVKVDQKFLERQISLSVNFKRSNDNLINSKSSSTTLSSFRINLGINIIKYPYLRIIYMPYFQSNDKEITTTDSNKIDNNTHILNIITGYTKRFRNIISQTNLMFSLQDTRTLFGLYDASTNSINLTQSFGFQIPLNLSASIGFVNSSYKGGDDSHLMNFDLNCSYTFFDIWQNSAGVTLTTDKGKNNKYGFFLNSSALLWNILNVDFRIEHNTYRETVLNTGNYDELSGRLTTGVSF